MPLFEYVCGKCDASFELLVRGSEVPRCPECCSEDLRKQFSVPAAHSAGGSGGMGCESPGSCEMPPCGSGGG